MGGVSAGGVVGGGGGGVNMANHSGGGGTGGGTGGGVSGQNHGQLSVPDPFTRKISRLPRKQFTQSSSRYTPQKPPPDYKALPLLKSEWRVEGRGSGVWFFKACCVMRACNFVKF